MQRKTCDYLLIRHLKPDIEAGVCYGGTDLAAAEPPSAGWQKLTAICELPVFSSPLQRAYGLAVELHQQGRISAREVQCDSCWQELDFGLWEGRSWSEIGQQAVEQWQMDLLNFCFPGGESAAQMQQRVLSGWTTWCQMECGGLLISHLGVIRMLLGSVLQIPFQSQLMIQIDYQHAAWLQQSWLQDMDGSRMPDTEIWQLKGMNLSPEALAKMMQPVLS